MQRERNSYAVQNVARTFDLLEYLAEESGGLTVTQLTERLNLSRNRVFRLLATLEGRGLVDRDPVTGIYQSGLAAMALAQRLLQGAGILRHARPILENLAQKHREAVYMTVLKDDQVLFLDMVDSPEQVKTTPLVGRRLPFFTNAAGKIMKSLESREILDRLLQKRSLHNDLPDPSRLADELASIRHRGVAVDHDGLGEGIISVAVAVRDYAGKVVGSLILIGPSFRMLTNRLENEIIPSLTESGELLSMRFGYSR
ncbi:MAG TPA: IclR family transcriptional regulator [Geobacterales bacterium]|nr:IclR family transcriptional regulator [Geobacterales bacterium]